MDQEVAETATSTFQKKVIVGIIKQLREKIIANGIGKQDMAELWRRMGYFQRRLGDNTAAIVAYGRALKIDPKNITAAKALKSLQGVNLSL